MMIIRVLPSSAAVNALVICYEYKRVYKHDGEEYFVKSLRKEGSGHSTRIIAELEPVYAGAL